MLIIYRVAIGRGWTMNTMRKIGTESRLTSLAFRSNTTQGQTVSVGSNLDMGTVATNKFHQSIEAMGGVSSSGINT